MLAVAERDARCTGCLAASLVKGSGLREMLQTACGLKCRCMSTETLKRLRVSLTLSKAFSWDNLNATVAYTTVIINFSPHISGISSSLMRPVGEHILIYNKALGIACGENEHWPVRFHS